MADATEPTALDREEIECELSKLLAEHEWREENWGGPGYRGEDELRGFIRGLSWVLAPGDDLTHPPSGHLSLRRGRPEDD